MLAMHTWTGAAGDFDFANPNNWDTGMAPVIDDENIVAAPGGVLIGPHSFDLRVSATPREI
jgi:hypothetical protein